MKTASLTIAFLFAACGGQGSSTTTPVTPADPAPDTTPAPTTAAEASVECFAGVGVVKLPSGQEVGQTEALARRTLEPATNSITEEFVQFKPEFRRFAVTMKVDGNKFEMTEAKGTFKGSGELVGEPWKWTSWSSRSELLDGQSAGMVVNSKDTRTADGISVVKEVLRPDGEPLVTISETLAEIELDECERRFAKLPTETPATK